MLTRVLARLEFISSVGEGRENAEPQRQRAGSPHPTPNPYPLNPMVLGTQHLNPEP
jgi:hypothetical protein